MSLLLIGEILEKQKKLIETLWKQFSSLTVNLFVLLYVMIFQHQQRKQHTNLTWLLSFQIRCIKQPEDRKHSIFTKKKHKMGGGDYFNVLNYEKKICPRIFEIELCKQKSVLDKYQNIFSHG